jgi:sulfotransferase
LLLIDYEFLTRRPREVVQLIYQFLDEPPFEHDFDNVDYDAEEFDAVLGVRGLHRVKPKVQPQTRETILPPDLHQRFQQQTFWRDLQGSRAHIITASGG